MFCFSGKKAGSDQPGQAEIDHQPGAGAANQVQVELQLDINSQDMDLVLDIPDLTQTEMETRRKAVTMMEVDNPQRRPLDDWSTPTDDDLPRITLDMFGAGGLLPDVFPDVQQELGSVLHDDGDLSLMPPPPVRPTSASDPHVEVTPTLQEEKKRRSPMQPVEDIADPGNMEDLNPPDIVVDPPVVDAEVEAQAQRLADVSMEDLQPEMNGIIQPPAPAAPEDLPVSFELLEVTSNPPKKKKRKLSRLQVDETTQLPMDVIKTQMVDYGDLLREREEEIPKAASWRLRGGERLTSGPGRALKGVLAAGWQEELAATRRLQQENYDWPEESLELEQEEELAGANPELNPTMEQEIPDDVSEIRANLGAGETVGEVNLSQTDNVQASAAAKDVLQHLELPPEVQLQDGDFLDLPPVQDLPVFPDVPSSPLRVGQQDEGPAPPLSPQLAAQLDLLTRPDDSVVSSSVLDHIQALLQPGQTRTLPSLVESGTAAQPTRREAAKMFHSLLVLEKREEVRMDQEDEEGDGFYTTISVVRI